MSWEELAWASADNESLGLGAPLLTYWPMLRSAIAENISADAMCPITCGELLVAHVPASAAATPLAASRSFELLGTDRRGSWASLDPVKGSKLGGKEYSPERLQELLLEALDSAFEAMLGEGLSVGDPIELSAPDAPLLLLRLPMTSVDGEEVALISAYDEVVGGELSAHVVALQALATEQPSAPPPPPQPVAQRLPEFKTPAVPRPTPSLAQTPAQMAAAAMANGAPIAGPVAGGPAAAGGPAVRPAPLPELTPVPTAAPTLNIDLLLGVNLQVAVEIGRTTLPIRDVLGLTPGSIVELDKLAGEKVDVLVNGRPIAQGEVVVVDENFGVRITDVVSRQQRLGQMAGHA